jgi:hypothetical protein
MALSQDFCFLIGKLPKHPVGDLNPRFHPPPFYKEVPVELELIGSLVIWTCFCLKIGGGGRNHLWFSACWVFNMCASSQ